MSLGRPPQNLLSSGDGKRITLTKSPFIATGLRVQLAVWDGRGRLEVWHAHSPRVRIAVRIPTFSIGYYCANPAGNLEICGMDASPTIGQMYCIVNKVVWLMAPVKLKDRPRMNNLYTTRCRMLSEVAVFGKPRFSSPPIFATIFATVDPK